MYRTGDLQFLEDFYRRSSNDIVLVYGDEFSDLKSLISGFIKNKDSFFYNALCVTENTQRSIFSRQMGFEYRNIFGSFAGYDSSLSPFLNNSSDSKKVLVIFDFQHILLYNPTYLNYLSGELVGNTQQGKIMIILATRDIRFVTSQLLKKVGRKSYEISAALKVRPLVFGERFDVMKGSFASYEGLSLSVILGGNLQFYNYDFSPDYKRFIVDNILDEKGLFCQSMKNLLPGDIRQPVMYNSILYYLANGINKLNKLHESLDTERSKVLVYLNTLMEYGLVEKCVSMQAGLNDETLKGYYRIVNSSVKFYYKYIFPNSSYSIPDEKESWFKKVIEPDISSFVEEYFPRLCMEYVISLEEKGRLSFEIEDMGEYLDKTGAIDFVIKVKDGNYICCGTQYSGNYMNYEKLSDIKASIKRNKIDCDNIWLFSGEEFDQKLVMTAGINPMIKLIGKKEIVLFVDRLI